MKSFIQKFFAVIFILSLATGCASSLTAPQPKNDNDKITNNDTPNNPDFGTDQDMQTMRDKPE